MHTYLCIHQRLGEIVMELSVKSNQWQTWDVLIYSSSRREAEGFQEGTITAMKCVQNIDSQLMYIPAAQRQCFPKSKHTSYFTLVLKIDIFVSQTEKCFCETGSGQQCFLKMCLLVILFLIANSFWKQIWSAVPLEAFFFLLWASEGFFSQLGFQVQVLFMYACTA